MMILLLDAGCFLELQLTMWLVKLFIQLIHVRFIFEHIVSHFICREVGPDLMLVVTAHFILQRIHLVDRQLESVMSQDLDYWVVQLASELVTHRGYVMVSYPYLHVRVGIRVVDDLLLDHRR